LANESPLRSRPIEPTIDSHADWLEHQTEVEVILLADLTAPICLMSIDWHACCHVLNVSDQPTFAEIRPRLEQMLAEVVVTLRRYEAERNLTLRVPQTGDFVAILRVDEHEARELAELLQGHW
jgi:hypothetical protein